MGRAQPLGPRGYAPLIVTLANTREVLYLVNRPGNAVSHEGCVPWIDRAIELVRPHAGQITRRGDTDFTLSGELDCWDSQGVKFILEAVAGGLESAVAAAVQHGRVRPHSASRRAHSGPPDGRPAWAARRPLGAGRNGGGRRGVPGRSQH